MSAVPTEPRHPCRLRQTTRPENPFPNPKNLGGGSIKKYAKGFLGGACPLFSGQVAGLVSQIIFFSPLHICSYLVVFAKMGSSVSVEMLQNTTFFKISARRADFLLGLAEAKPNVFLGGMRFWVAGSDRVFVFARRRRFFVIMKLQPIH